MRATYKNKPSPCTKLQFFRIQILFISAPIGKCYALFTFWVLVPLVSIIDHWFCFFSESDHRHVMFIWSWNAFLCVHISVYFLSVCLNTNHTRIKWLLFEVVFHYYKSYLCKVMYCINFETVLFETSLYKCTQSLNALNQCKVYKTS